MHIPFPKSYHQDHALWPENPLYRVFYALLIGAGFLLPMVGASEFLVGELTLFLIYSGVGLSLVFLTGISGMVSLGHAAFLAIGAYAHTLFLAEGLPFLASLILVTGCSLLAGFFLSLPLRQLKGVYLSIATLALAVLIQELCVHWKSLTGGLRGLMVDEGTILGLSTENPTHLYYVCLVTVLVTIWAAKNLMRSPRGRALVALRDSELSGKALGINIAWAKAFAFTTSAGIAGLFGGLLAHQLQFLTPEAFSPIFSIQLLLMVVVGGVGSFHGAFLGAFVMIQIPQFIAMVKEWLPATMADAPGLEPGGFGVILVLLLAISAVSLIRGPEHPPWCLSSGNPRAFMAVFQR